MHSLSKALLNKLALAKEMYVLGLDHKRENTRINKMLAILNLDFATGTLVIAACIRAGKDPRRKDGRSKNWQELIDVFKEFYFNNTLISDITSLHELRNSIQHGATIPSDWDIDKYQETVKILFDDLCQQIFNGEITYDSISMANLLKSNHERELMLKAEEYLGKGFNGIALQIIHTVVIYHYMLIKTNLSLPILPRYEFYSSPRFSKGNITQIDKDLLDIYTDMDRAIDRLAFGEHYLRMLDLLKNAKPSLSFRYAYSWISQLQIVENVTCIQVEDARDSLYRIILGTEHLITEQLIVGSPVVYGLYIENITENCATVNYGILSKVDLEECNLKVYEDMNMNSLIETVALPQKQGYQYYKLENLHPEKSYKVRIEVTQKADGKFAKSLNWADRLFTTMESQKVNSDEG